jgi:hypothetical protein
MKKNMITGLAIAILLLGGCNSFDDSQLWKGVDETYNELTQIKTLLSTMKPQVSLLSSIVNGGVVTSITQDADGHYVVKYKGADNVEYSVTVATKEDVNTSAIIGMTAVNGVYYWTTTVNGKTSYILDTDKSKIPVSGRTPEFAIDSEGYWTVNGSRIKDASGNPVKADSKTASLINAVAVNKDGTVTFTLGDGSSVTAKVFGAFNISLTYGGTAVEDELKLDDITSPAVLNYTLTGSSATVVKIMRPSDLTASVDTAARTITVTVASDFESGSFMIMLSDDSENVLVRPVKVVFSASQVTYNGIKTASDLVRFSKAVADGKSLDRFRNETGDVVLLSDVDMSGVSTFSPIGTATNPFQGIFNGQGFSIKNVNLSFDAASAKEIGLFGVLKGATVKNLTFGAAGDKITVTGTPASGTEIGGIAASATDGSTIYTCTNNVGISFTGSAPSGVQISIGGIAGAVSNAVIGSTEVSAACVNNGSILIGASGAQTGVTGILSGGLVGSTVANDANLIKNCTNNGNIVCGLTALCGGFVGSNNATITSCTNKGAIIADKTTSGSVTYGPGWACGSNTSAKLIETCKGYGYVGDYTTCKNNPLSAPAAMHNTAVSSPKTNYDPENNTVDMTLDAYYDWTMTASKTLHTGVDYSAYSFNNMPRLMHVLTIDLTQSDVEITTALCEDEIPDPNWNNRNNNGKNIRETLSEICARKRAEGQNIIAGINSGFFDSQEGILRGMHVEEGCPVYVNNLAVRNGLPNHRWGFAAFTDKTASCAVKTFTGKFEVDGTDYSYTSINDTILRHGTAAELSALYTAKYKKVPHAAYPTRYNLLNTNAYYIVAKFTSGAMMTVNNGWFEAKVTAIYDGRTTALSEAPYLSDADQIGIQLRGSMADEVAAKVSVGATIKVRADITMGTQAKPIQTLNSSMYILLSDGVDNSSSANITTYDPLTFIGVDNTGTKVHFFVVDGRQDWVSMGVNGYEMVRIAQKFDCYNMTRVDGGGSTTMWVYSDGAGKVVNTPSDDKGERSCLSYLQVRIK